MSTKTFKLKNDITNALDTISPPWVSTDPSHIRKCKKKKNTFLDTPFDLVEFNTTLNSANEKSSPGIDGIDYETLVNLPIKFKLLLLDIFNEMFKTGQYPEVWQKSFIHFINKPSGNGVRPIALTPCISKLFESLIKNRLQWWCEFNNFLPPSQSGFRKGRSCADNLANLMLQAEHTLSKNKDLLAAFLDVCGAFDHVNIEILLQKLASIGCSTKVLKFIKFLTFQRTIFADALGEHYRVTYKGVPQGGVLSPLLFIIYIKV